MSTPQDEAAQRVAVAKVRELIASGLSRPLQASSGNLSQRAYSRFVKRSPNNPFALFKLLAEPTDLAFIYGLYWLFFKREPDMIGIRTGFTGLTVKKMPRARLALRYALTAEARGRKVQRPLAPWVILFLGPAYAVSSIPVLRSLIRFVWRLGTLNAALSDLEVDLNELRNETASFMAEWDDRAEFEHNQRKRAVGRQQGRKADA